MKKALIALVLLALVAPTVHAAKERGNRTKCSNQLRRTAEGGIANMENTVERMLPTVKRLLAAGKTKQALQVAENASRQIDHRGHVTVLKLQETGDSCLAHMRADGASAREIATFLAQWKKTIATVRRAQARFDSFFDIEGE